MPGIFIPHYSDLTGAGSSTGALSPKQGSSKLSPLAQGRANLSTATAWNLPGIKPPVKSATPAAPTAANHTRATQQMLKNQGYNITVDGISGPQTSAAITAFHGHVPPGVFNAKNAKPLPNAPVGGPKNAAATAKRAIASGAGTPYVNKGPGFPKGAGATDGAKPGTFSPVKGGANPGAPSGGFDPNQFATAAANAQYDPAIQSLQGQIKNYQGSEPNLLEAIKNMYAGATQQYQQLLGGEQGAGAQGQQDLSQAFGNAGALFGQSNQGQMQTPQGIAQGELAGVNQAEQDYLKNMQPIQSDFAASQGRNADSQYQSQIQNLLGQLQQQQQAKGNAYVTDYQTGLNNEMQLQQNQSTINTANALLPYQIQSAKAQASADASNAAYAPAINQGKVDQSAAAAAYNTSRIPLVQAQTTKALADAKKALTSNASGANKNLLPGSSGRQKLVTTLNQSLLTTDPQTGATTKLPPPQASQALFQSAVSQGLMSSSGKELVPGFAEILKTTLQTAYPGYKWPWMKK